MAIPREIELKLEITSTAAERLRRDGSGLLDAGTSAHQHLVSVYFDTPKRALRRNGLTLRVRHDGDRRLQTVKEGEIASAGLFDRREWESEITGDDPDLAAAERTPAGRLLCGKKGPKAIAPVFETVVDRTTWRVEREGSEIEVALDEGRVQANGSTRAFAEIEIELKRGSPADLFAFTRDLVARQSPQIGVLTKSERGYALVGGEAPTCFKAEPVALRPETTAAEAFRIVAHACIRQFRLNETLLIETRSPDSLHQARVGIRRLRSALSVFGPIATDGQYPRFKRRLKALSGQLGAARNVDVYMDRLAEGGRADCGVPASVTADVMESLAAERTRAYDRVIATIGAKRFRHLMLDLVGWLEVGAWHHPQDEAARAMIDEPLVEFAAGALKRRRRKVKRLGHRIEDLSPEERHRARIAAKKLRYACEFFAGLAQGGKARRRHKAFLEALEDLQTSLGDLNDLASGHELAAKLSLDGDASRLEAAAEPPEGGEDREARLVAAAAQAHRELTDIKPFWA